MPRVQLPAAGRPTGEVRSEMREARAGDCDWRRGRAFGLVYNAGDELMEFVEGVARDFMAENALGPNTFPSLRRFEAEVVGMTAGMLHGDDEVVGTMTSGGTESILMAVKAARDWARAERGGDASGMDILIPASAHPAFDKAAHYLGLGVRHIPLARDFRADVAAAAEMIDDRTILMVGSAVGYPHGVIDPIAELAALAQARGVWFHTDACLGGFLLPWVERLGRPVPPWDFRVPGVCSISADVHKYGFAAKGASTVLYKDDARRRHQFFVHTEWCGGVYATPAVAGARGGASIAAAWAVMNHLGEAGYLRLARGMMATTNDLLAGINAIDGLQVLGEPPMTVFAVGSDRLNVYAIADMLEAGGWHIGRQHRPAALHFMVSPIHAEVKDELLADLRKAADVVRQLPPQDVSGMAAIYGMMGTMPDRGAVKELTMDMLSQLFR